MITTTEEKILSALVQRPDYFKKVFPFLKEEYFDVNLRPHRNIFKIISTYVEKYKQAPTRSVCEIALQNISSLNQDSFSELGDLVDRIYDKIDSTKDSVDWLSDMSEKWCQERSLYNALSKSIEIFDGSAKNLAAGAIPDLFKDALSVHFDRDIGHDYSEDADKRYQYYHSPETRIPFDLDIFNKATNGGVLRKTLNCVVAATNVGKSLFLCHLAAWYYTMGLNVLYITCEMGEESIGQRIDANLMDVDIIDVARLPQPIYENKMRRISQATTGRLIIRQYPTTCGNVNIFRSLLDELELKKAFKADVIIVDYLNLCSSVRHGSGASAGSYEVVKAIAEELRGLMVERNAVGWTATQFNRSGYGSDPDITHTSESMALPNTLDFYIAMIRNEDLDNMGQALFKQYKSRYAEKTDHPRFLVGLDRVRMKFYDVSQTTLQQVQTTVQNTNNAQQQNGNPGFNFAGGP